MKLYICTECPKNRKAYYTILDMKIYIHSNFLKKFQGSENVNLKLNFLIENADLDNNIEEKYEHKICA